MGSNTNNFILWRLLSPECLRGMPWNRLYLKVQSEMSRAKISSAKGRKEEVLLSSYHFQGRYEWQKDHETCESSSMRRCLRAACLSGALAVLTPCPLAVSDFGRLQSLADGRWAGAGNLYVLCRRHCPSDTHGLLASIRWLKPFCIWPLCKWDTIVHIFIGFGIKIHKSIPIY